MDPPASRTTSLSPLQTDLPMPTLRAVLPPLCFLAGGAFLLRGVSVLSSQLDDAAGQTSAYADGYAAGQAAAGLLLVTAAMGLILLGWRRLRH